MSDRVRIVDSVLLSDNWYLLKKFTFDYKNNDGIWARQTREVYDRGNGATILLYNRASATVVLTKQFRIPTFVNGNPDGMLIEACAGLLDKDDPETCIKRETQEETGFNISAVEKVFEAYMSPGSVTEILYFFIAEYEAELRTGAGGGVEGEEDIDVLTIPFREAMRMIADGRIRDGKTIMLLQHLALKGILAA